MNLSELKKFDGKRVVCKILNKKITGVLTSTMLNWWELRVQSERNINIPLRSDNIVSCKLAALDISVEILDEEQQLHGSDAGDGI